MKKLKLIFIYGPTGSGKSKLAAKLLLDSPNSTLLVSVDSRKVYKDLDIGTNKLAIVEFFKEHKIPLAHLLGVNLVEITKPIDVSQYYSMAKEQLRISLTPQIDTIVFFGGSALYHKALLEGLDNTTAPVPELRELLNTLSSKQIRDLARTYLLQKYTLLNRSDQNNPRRLIRLIEKNLKDFKEKILNDSKPQFSPPDLLTKLKLVLQKITPPTPSTIPPIQEAINSFTPTQTEQTFYIFTPSLSELKPQLEKRVIKMFNQGWLQEAKELIQKYKINSNNFEGFPGLNIMGYHYIAKHLLGISEHSIKEPISLVTQEHIKYAKQQLTWARKFMREYDSAQLIHTSKP